MADTRIPLPPYVTAPVDVFVNGVRLSPKDDYTLEPGELVIHRELEREGKLGFWAWFLGAWGIGTYRKNDVVDVRYTRDGVSKVAHDLDFEATASSEA